MGVEAVCTRCQGMKLQLCRRRIPQPTKLVQLGHRKVVLERSISHFDRTLINGLCSDRRAHTGLMVFYTGLEPPDCCSPMVRDPLPTCGQVVDCGFSLELQEAMRANPSVHDGATMCGRGSLMEDYRITGWSYRLYPPAIDGESFPNKGSAFNSGLAMSRVDSVDKVLFWSSGRGWCFERGCVLGLVQR